MPCTYIFSIQYFYERPCHKHAVVKFQPALQPHLKMCPLRSLQTPASRFLRQAENWTTNNNKGQFENTDKMMSSYLDTAGVTSIFVSFPSDPAHSLLMNDKAENHMMSFCYQELSGPSNSICEGRVEVRSIPKTLQARNCCSDGTAGVSTGRTVITFALESSNRHNSAQL